MRNYTPLRSFDAGSPTILRGILTLGAPTTAIALLQAVAQLIETWLAARQGTAALAGWAVMLPFSLLLQQMSAGAMLLRIAIAVGGGWWLASGASPRHGRAVPRGRAEHHGLWRGHGIGSAPGASGDRKALRMLDTELMRSLNDRVEDFALVTRVAFRRTCNVNRRL